MWKLTIEDDQANKTVVHLVREDYGIGRAEENAIRLTERNISRRHARLERTDEHWLIKDVSSYNGCYLNGHRVAASEGLSHGDLIQVGDYRLLVEDEALLTGQDISTTVPAIPRGASSPGQDRLVMLAGPAPGSEFVLTQERMLIGRGEDCDISITHPSVSRVHAELHPLGEGRYEIFDKNSANGVRVNGVELPRSFVEPRDVVELGDVILKFIPAGQIYIPGTHESLQIAAIGAARRQEAEEGQPRRFSTALLLKFGIVLGLALFAIALLFVTTRRGSGTLELEAVKEPASERASSILSEAMRLLARGDPVSAYKKAAELPLGTGARASADYKTIQAAYADHLFELAEKAADPADKRTLLDEIARSPGVDSARRKRAAAALTALSTPSVDVNELPPTPARLPSAAPPGPTPSLEPASGAPASREGAPSLAESERKSVAPPKPAPAKAAVPATLVRENPFDAPSR